MGYREQSKIYEETKSGTLWLPRAKNWENEELLLNEYKFSVREDEKILEIDGGDGGTTKQILNTREQYTYKWLKWYILCCVHFTIIFKQVYPIPKFSVTPGLQTVCTQLW